MSPAIRPSRDEFRALARDYTVVPVWREVLADLETPLSAFVKLVGDREGFLLESVEHAERWGRFSFLGRNPARTFVARGRNIEWLGGAAPDGVPADQGALAVLEALLAHFRAPTLPELPPFHGGIVGWMGYDTVREIENLPVAAARRSRLPRRGVFARRERRRVRSLPPAPVPHRERVPAAGRRCRDHRRDVRRCDGAPRQRGRRSRPAVAVRARAAARRRARRTCRR